MRRVEAKALIASSADRAFALYDDIPNTPDWVPFVSEILAVSPGRTGVGTVYREKTRLLGIPSVQEWRIVEHRPPREQVHASHDMAMDSRLTMTFVTRGSGTLLTQAVELDSRLPGPVGWLHELLVAAVAGRSMASAIAGGKRMLERT
jgi:polyketide cyclase/dehydrase/lipid transport protein